MLKCCHISKKPVHSRLLYALLSFLFCAFGLKLALAQFLFEFRFSLNAPLLAMQDVLAVLDLSGQYQLGGDVGHARFEFLNIIILPSGQYFFRPQDLLEDKHSRVSLTSSAVFKTCARRFVLLGLSRVS